jgi:hypothetical protein
VNAAPESLAALQRRTQAHVLAPTPASTPAIESSVANHGGVGAAVRLAVYADAYRLRLLEVLREDYRALSAWLGDDAFADLGHAYIATHPSHARSIRWFGRHLADFLVQRHPAQPLLTDLARFEWARGLAFDAADSEPVAMDDLARIDPGDWPGLTFRLVSSLQRIELRCNAPTLFPDLLSGDPPAPVETGDAPTPWIIWRIGLLVHWRSMDRAEAHLLDEVAGGADFGRMCELLADLQGIADDTAAALAAAGMLKRWLADGLVAGVETPDHAGDEGRASRE